MSDQQLRIGVIGTGVMGADHVKTITESVSGARIAAVADIDLDRARAVAEPIGAVASGDALDLIAGGTLDGVIIASADRTHAELTLAAIAAGLPVLCEKPLAPTVAECEAIVAAEQAAGRPLVQVGFMRRFDPSYTDLRRRIAAGEIGAALIAHAVHRNVSMPAGWDATATIVNSLVHELDVMPWLLDSPVVEVLWLAARESTRVHYADPQVTLLRLRNGALVTVEVTANAVYGYEVRCETVGELGTLELTTPVTAVQRRGGGVRHDLAADWRPRFAEAYRIELQHWANAIRDTPEHPVAGPGSSDGLVAAQLTEAVLRSRETGGWQAVPTTATTASPESGDPE